MPLAALEKKCASLEAPPPLSLSGHFDVIAEIKTRSPSMGPLKVDARSVAERARLYASGGAVAVSVLTEPLEFHGSLEDLSAAATALAPHGVPAMRKDFLSDVYQIFEARALGAGGALLIVRMLSDRTLAEMLDCIRNLAMFALVEAFDADDVARAQKAVEGRDADDQILIGVNSRDLATLKIDSEKMRALARLLPKGFPRVAESGLETAGDAEIWKRAGYDAALVGSALMRAPDPGALLADMIGAGRAA
jgi:indole-3-glycerol phosphate synthase